MYPSIISSLMHTIHTTRTHRHQSHHGLVADKHHTFGTMVHGSVWYRGRDEALGFALSF